MKQDEKFKLLDFWTAEGMLRKVASPCGQYVLWNYTDQATFTRCWNETTVNARGTIYNIQTGEVVARTFPKFWNHEELSPEKQAEVLAARNFTCFEKCDGSLGVVAYYDGKWRVSTRGSFTSDQAVKAEQMLANYDLSRLLKNVTYLVEIIYPENKIIVNYGPEEKLVLLAAFDTKTGIEYAISGTDVFPTPKTYSFESVDQIIESQVSLPWTDEGFVLRLANGERVKFKSKEYMKIAKIKANMSPLTFWEKMKEGDEPFSKWMQSLPEELRADADKIHRDVALSYQSVEWDVYQLRNEVFGKLFGVPPLRGIVSASKENKKALGIFLKENPKKYGGTLFYLLDGNSQGVRDFIFKEIRPTGNVIRGTNDN